MDLRAENEAHDPSHQRRLAQAVMRRQLVLSLRVAAVFIVILLGLPLVNYFMPGLANLRMGGFTLTWLFLAVLFYPVTWILSWVFIRRSDEIEGEIARSMRRGAPEFVQAHSSDAAAAGSSYVAAASDETDSVGEDNR